MAEFMTPEEIQAQAQNLYDLYDKGAISAKQLADGLNDCNKGVRNFTQELNASLNQLGTSAKRLGEDLKDGKQGAAVFNDALNSGADTIAKYSTQFGPLGAAIGAVVKVLTYFVSAANEQSDALYKANQDLSKVGAAGARGMTEIYENLKEFGYGIADINDMTRVIGQNSVALSNFYGTVADGAKAMAGVAKGIQSSDLQRQFMNMGYSVDAINTGIGQYITQQSAFGTSRRRTQEELKVGAADYLRNMSELSKLTGQSAEEMAQQRDEALAIDAFNAALDGMTETQRENQLAKFNALSKFDKDAAIGFANQVSGFIGIGKQSQQLYMSTGGSSATLAKNADQSAAEFLQGISDAYKGTEALRKSYALYGGTDVYLAFGKSQKLANLSDGQILKAAQEAKKQTQEQADGADKLTDSATKTRESQMSARDGMENLVNAGVLPVTEAMEGLADTINTILHPLKGTEDKLNKLNSQAVSAGAGYKGAPVGNATGSADLKALGLKVKEGDVQQEGAKVSPKLLELAQAIQGKIPGFSHFSSFNDKFHNERAPSSQHTKGLALDFSVANKPSKEEGEKIVAALKGLGASSVIDEYNNPSSQATAGHFHVQVSAAEGAILNGPRTGYKPNLTMHGEEAIVPLDKFKLTPVSNAQSNMPPMGTAGLQPEKVTSSSGAVDSVDGTEAIVTELKTLLSEIQRGARTQRQMAS